MRNQILASVAMAMLGACVGGIDTPPAGDDDDDQPTGTTARQQFDSNVLPLLHAKCEGCHTGPETTTTNMFMGTGGSATAYDTLVKDRAVNGGFVAASATILLKGAHSGPAWTSTENATIAAWLSAELTARGGSGPDTPTTGVGTVRGAEMAFAACLSVSLTEYNTTQAYQVANMNSGNGRCYSCHEPGGAGGQYLGRANTYKDMFGKWQQEVFFTGVFQAQLQPDNTYKIAAAENKICLKGKEKENNLGTHPPFDCNQNNSTALNNLKLFVTQVQAKVTAGTGCPTPAFAPPTP